MNIPTRSTTIRDISPGISFGMSSGVVMEVVKKDIEPDAVAKKENSNKPWAKWGSDNKHPQKLIDENMQQETSAGALAFKIMAHFGMGLYFYTLDYDSNGREVKKPIKISALPPEIKQFWYENDLNNFSQAIIADFEWFNFYYPQYIPNKLGTKIVRVNHLRSKDVRAGKRDGKLGNIPAYYLSGYWGIDGDNVTDYAELPVFDKSDPFKHPNAVAKHQLISIDKDYYPTAYWQSNFRWLAVAKKIPHWILSNIDNSVNIKYHVEIPEQYFLDLYLDDYYNSKEEARAARKAAEEALKIKIDECLAGADNASKIFYTKFAVDQSGTIMPGWKINVLENKLQDGAWLNAYATAAAATCTAHGVDPGLTGIVSPSALNVGSGSDLREKFNFYMQLRTVIPRQTTLEWWEVVKRVNQWDEDIHLGYKNVLLDTLDNAKSGFVSETEQAPTSLNK